MVPDKLTAGDRAFFTQDSLTIDGVEFKASLFTLTFYFRPVSGLIADVFDSGAGTANANDGWDFAFDLDDDLAAGIYYYAAKAVRISDSKVFTVLLGQTQIGADITSATDYDGRSQARKDLEAVQTAMRAIMTGGAIQEYMIGTRSVKRIPMNELIALESKLKAEVAREDRDNAIKNGQGNPNTLFTRFRR